MRIPGLTKLPGLRTARWLAQRAKGWKRSRAIILMYHRIGELDADPWYLRVRPENFDDQMRVLRRLMRPMSMHQLREALRDSILPDRAVVVSFDDGYANNLHLAKPVLERYEIPATIFVTTGYLGTTIEYWWDELEQILLRPGSLPPSLHLRDMDVSFELGPAMQYTAEEYHHDCAHTRDHSQRLQFYYKVWERLRPLAEGHRRRILQELWDWAGTSGTTRESRRSLTQEELRELHRGNLVSIGAHTVTHPLLSELAAEEQRREIRDSKLYLQRLLEKGIDSFSYPFGRYTEETVSLVRSEGFTSACSVTHGLVGIGADCLLLPRFSVLDWSGKEFEDHLLRWLNGSTA